MRPLHFIVFSVLAAAGIAGEPPAPKPRFSAVIICFTGEVDSRGSARMGLSTETNDLKYETGGRMSELHWEFQRTEGKGDVWRITRQFSANGVRKTTEQKYVTYEGVRTVVFRDEFQVVVIDPAPPGK